MKAPLTGRTMLVTGASRGIGFAIAQAAQRAGARVAIVARGAEPLAKRATELGGSAVAIPCDVTDESAVTAMVARVRSAFGDIPDIVVNNAGVFAPAALEITTTASFRESVAVNLIAPFLVARAVLPRMVERHAGHLVTIGSAADRHAYAENGAYSAGKAGARAMHEVLRAEVRGSGVRTTLVSPGAVNTGVWDAIEPDGRGRFPNKNAMLEVEDVAAAVLYAVTQPPRVNVDELRLARA